MTMRTYRVKIEIDVDADDALDAAEHAWELLVSSAQITAKVRPDNRGRWELVTIGEPIIDDDERSNGPRRY